MDDLGYDIDEGMHALVVLHVPRELVEAQRGLGNHGASTPPSAVVRPDCLQRRFKDTGVQLAQDAQLCLHVWVAKLHVHARV